MSDYIDSIWECAFSDRVVDKMIDVERELFESEWIAYTKEDEVDYSSIIKSLSC